jgi:hypothetical protein
MAVGDIVELRTEINFGQILSINNFHFRAKTSTPTWADRIADKWIDDVAVFFTAFLSPDCTHTQVELHDVIGSEHHRTFIDIIPPIAGGLGGAACPGQVAAKITWYPDGSHRSQRGRTFLGGVAADQIDSARRINGAVDSFIRAWADTLLGLWGPSGTESGAEFVILSRQLNGAPRSPVVGLPVLEYNVPSILGTQRRRLL